MEYLKKFDKHTDYEASKTDLTLPNVSYCITENEVHYNPILIIDGHEYVDLGLPSGTLWATMNIGAESETDIGLYFAWGETKGYVDNSTRAFDKRNYKWYYYNDYFYKYNTYDNKTTLDPEDDAAYVNWGSKWRMPTYQQIVELYNNNYTTREKTTNGYIFTSKLNGKTIFFPMSGYYYNNTLVNTDKACGIARNFNSNETMISTIWGENGYFMNVQRYEGIPVRPVVG